MIRAAIVLVMVASIAAEPVSELHPSNYVNDFADVLDLATESRLNALAKQVDEKAKAQIAVVTVKSTDAQDIVSYAVDLYQRWGIGKKGTDRGVLILLAVEDRKYWTTVGYGLEAILPDGKVGGFGREAVPFLKAGDYSGAVSLIVGRVADVIATDAGVTLEGAQAPKPRHAREEQSPGAIGVVGLIVMAAIVVLVLRAASRSTGGRGHRAGGSGFLPGLLAGILLDSMRHRGRGGWYGGSGGGGWGDWGGGGFGGGGGGFGGFGGGSTGGGGAGGSW